MLAAHSAPVAAPWSRLRRRLRAPLQRWCRRRQIRRRRNQHALGQDPGGAARASLCCSWVRSSAAWFTSAIGSNRRWPNFTKTDNAPSTQKTPASQAPPENGDSGKSPANSPTNNQNEQVSKALDGIGGLMDRLGFRRSATKPIRRFAGSHIRGNLKESLPGSRHRQRNCRLRLLPKSAPAASPCARDSCSFMPGDGNPATRKVLTA